MADRPSRLTLARFAAGELPPDEARAVEAVLAEDEGSRRALESLRANVERYGDREAQHRRSLLARLEAERGPAPRWWAPWIWPAVGTVTTAAAAVVLVVTLQGRGPSGPAREGGGQGAEQILFKGDVAVRIVAQRAGSQFAVHGRASLLAGDALRFVVTTAGAGFVTVFSVDGVGHVSPFYPPGEGDEPAALDAPGQHQLPGSTILDDARGPEHLVVCFSPRRFSRRKLHDQVRAQIARGELGAPRGEGERRTATGETLVVTTVNKR